MVVSSATTGLLEFKASRTSSETRKKPLLVKWRLPDALATAEQVADMCGLRSDFANSLMIVSGGAFAEELWRGGALAVHAQTRRCQELRREHDAIAAAYATVDQHQLDT